MPIKVMVVDDHTLFRKGLIAILSDISEIQIVGEAENGKEFLSKYSSINPDIILMDMDMPVLNGIDALIKLRERKNSPPCLMISMHNEDKFVLKAIEAGANGYLTKDSDPDIIHLAIQSIMCNGFYFDEKVNLLLVKNMAKKKKIAPKFESNNLILNAKETLLIKSIGEELTSSEIAEKMFCSVRTIEGLRTDLIKKVGVKNAIGLAIYGIKNGIIAV
jgi:DNA-binding NarL/FixJ family response regulator